MQQRLCPTCSKPISNHKNTYCSIRCSKVGKQTWNKGKTGLSNIVGRPRTYPRLPCCICGNDTKYPDSPNIQSRNLRFACEKPECRYQARVIRGINISKTKSIQAAMGQHHRPKGWSWVERVSIAENAIRPWFVSAGWSVEYNITTGVTKESGLSRWFRLDFALPIARLCVEIDGSSHKLLGRTERDARRDIQLQSIGWNTLRIASALVMADIEEAQSRILSWQREQIATYKKHLSAYE